MRLGSKTKVPFSCRFNEQSSPNHRFKPTRTTGRFRRAKVFSFVDRLAFSPSRVRYAIDSDSCTARLDDIAHAPPPASDASFRDVANPDAGLPGRTGVSEWPGTIRIQNGPAARCFSAVTGVTNTGDSGESAGPVIPDCPSAVALVSYLFDLSHRWYAAFLKIFVLVQGTGFQKETGPHKSHAHVGRIRIPESPIRLKSRGCVLGGDPVIAIR